MNNESPTLAQRFALRERKVITADPQVLTLRYSPDGKRLVAGGYDGRIRCWDAASEELPELAPVAVHEGWPQGLVFAPDGETLFSGDSWGALCAWSMTAAEPTARWKVAAAHAGWLRDVALRGDGQLLATCGVDRVVRLWNPADGAPVGEIVGEQADLYVLRFTPDGRHLVAGDRLGRVWQWDVATRELVRKFDATALYKYDRIQDVGGVRTLAFSADGALLAVGGMKPKNGATIQGIPALLLFDFATGEQQRTFDLGGNNDCDLMDVHLHAEGFFIAVTNGGPGQGKVVLQQLDADEPFLTETKIANVQSLAYLPGAARLAVSGTNRGSNGNGRRLDKEGNYPGNQSPIHIFDLGEPAA